VPYAQSAGVRIYYEDSGQGVAVVLLPGLGMATPAWEPVRERLAAHHRVVVIDPRGAGQSDKPDEPYTGETMAGDVIAVLDAAGIESAHLVGHSMGGMIIQEVAIRHAPRALSVVLAATYAATDEWSQRVLDVRRLLIEQLGLEQQFRVSVLFVFSPRSFRTMRDWIASLEARLRDNPPDPRGYLHQLDFCRQHDARDRLRRVAVPALVVTGAEDILTSAIQGRELAGLIPGARYQEYPQASHGVVWEEAEAFAGLVTDFVADRLAA
jgi:pimeloyl-ACP methyl ester carboxylesterase